MQQPSRSSRFDLTALGHPIWWGALALLVINDNLLKGRGVVPGWLTGKLSDFSFLIVAPVLLAALLPRAWRARRALALAAITGLYVAADLSAAASDAVVGAAARLGMSWRLWPDPTDLVALAVLPVTVWLLRRPPRAGRPAAGRFARERAGAILGAVACLATSAPRRPMHAPFLVNRTAASADTRVTWVLRKIDCTTTTPEMLAATLKTSDLDDPRALSLASGQVAVLDGPRPADQSPVGVCFSGSSAGGGACVAAILEAPAANPVVMVAQSSWVELGDEGFISCGGPPPVSQCRPTLSPAADPGPDAVSLLVRNGVTLFEGAGSAGSGRIPSRAKVRIAPIDLAAVRARTPDADGCRPTRDAYRAGLGATACQTSVDCRVVGAAALPGESQVCDVYVASTAAASIETLASRWNAACLSEPSSCAPAKPAACVDGGCAAVCGQQQVPMCPASCSRYTTAQLCSLNAQCMAANGDFCICGSGMLSCYPVTPPDPDCPLVCIPWEDAGAPADGGLD